MEGAVDGNNIALRQHLLQVLDSAAANILLLLRWKRLVVEVQELLAVERLQPAKHTLTDTANGDSTDDLVLEIVFVLGDCGDVPFTAFDLLVGWDEVTDEDEDGHDDMLCHRHDVGTSDFCNGDTAIGLVGGIQIDVVRTDSRSDGDFEVLGLRETLCGEIAWMEAVIDVSLDSMVDSQATMLNAKMDTYGVVMMTSASTSSWSNLLFSPSLSEVVTSVWPWSSSHLRMPSSFSVVPKSCGSC